MKKIGDVANSDAVNDEFTEGDPQGGVPATVVKSSWLNTVQRELVALVEHQEGELDVNDDGQILTAVRNLAQGAGAVSLLGEVSKGTGNTLNLPEGHINIGGNGYGYVLEAATDWNPLGVGNNDGSFAALALGDDVYIYAVQQASGVAKWVASVNATVPSGYTADNSRKVGGFHYGRVRPIANRYDTAYAPVTEIISNSCWDLLHRPTCDPTGMVEAIPGKLWVDIYLNSVGSGSWPDTIPVSAYGGTVLRNNVYVVSEFIRLLRNVGKRFPTAQEFIAYAYGALEGGSNDHAWTASGNAAPCSAGFVAKAVSCLNVVDAVGNVFDACCDIIDLGDTNGVALPFGWSDQYAANGQDGAYGRGNVAHVQQRCIAAGGMWSHETSAGAITLSGGYAIWDQTGVIGFRGVCESK